MKKMVFALFLFTAVIVARYLPAQEKYEPITVKRFEINNGVVILAAQSANKGFELQCNTNVADCSTISPGKYVMVRLPKNWGTYDCANVDVYHKPVNHEDLGKKLGEYCLLQQ